MPEGPGAGCGGGAAAPSGALSSGAPPAKIIGFGFTFSVGGRGVICWFQGEVGVRGTERRLREQKLRIASLCVRLMTHQSEVCQAEVLAHASDGANVRRSL